jgi:tetratricopeptide (TPR) repeat protein
MAAVATADRTAVFAPAWKLARVCYWLGGHTPGRDGRSYYERGIEAGRQAIAADPNRPEGHFWVAANMGALAESSGVMAGLRYRGTIKRELETVLKLDAPFMSGSADRALGRWYHKVPGLFGGSRARAEAHLKASLKYDPNSTVSHYFLAEVLIDEDRTQEARAELTRVLEAPPNPEWGPEDAEYKQRAKALLATLR